MSDDQFRQLLEDGWEAYKAGSWDQLENLLHDDIEWHEFHREFAAATADFVGKQAVMDHFRECKGLYGDPEDRKYHLVKGDHAVVTDQIRNEPGRCTDLYRIEDNKIREMWTCVTDPTQEASGESVTA